MKCLGHLSGNGHWRKKCSALRDRRCIRPGSVFVDRAPLATIKSTWQFPHGALLTGAGLSWALQRPLWRRCNVIVYHLEFLRGLVQEFVNPRGIGRWYFCDDEPDKWWSSAGFVVSISARTDLWVMVSHGFTSLAFSLQTDPWYYCITWAMPPSFLCKDGLDYYVDLNKPARSVENVIASRTFSGIKAFWYRDCANLFDFRFRRVGISRATLSLWLAITPHSRCPSLDRRQPYIISRAENPGQLISRHLAVATSRLAVRDG